MMVDPNDFEAGEEPIEVERRLPPGVVVSIRMDADEARLLFDAARRSGKTIVEVAKDGVLEHLRAVSGETAR